MCVAAKRSVFVTFDKVLRRDLGLAAASGNLNQQTFRYRMCLHYQCFDMNRSQAKPSRSSNWGAETCAKRKSTSPCLLAIPAFDHIAGLYNRHLNSKRRICLR